MQEWQAITTGAAVAVAVASLLVLVGQRTRRDAEIVFAVVSGSMALSASGVLQASSELTRILALQIVFTTTCWLSFERFMPGRDGRDTDPGLAAFYTLTLISPYISGESRAYLDYLKSKYLG